MNTDIKPICIGCSELAENIPEYKAAAELIGIPVNDYVEVYEGTFNQINAHFYCTKCYFEAGLPLGVAP